MSAASTFEAPGALGSRVALWDNARFIMIVLVVFNHTIATLRTADELHYGIYTLPFFVHMPAMILIAGYFAKPTVTRRSVRAVMRLIAAWLTWEVIWIALRAWVDDNPPNADAFIAPAWTLWFLLSLATMRILLPYLVRLRYPLLVTIGIALLAGMLPDIGPEFALSRTLCFLPFFVGGWLLRDRGLLEGPWFARPSRAVRWGAAGVLVLAVVVWVLINPLQWWHVDVWLRWDESYAVQFAEAPIGAFAPTGWWQTAFAGLGIRAALLLISGVLVAAALLCVPRTNSAMTRMGTRTLTVYLLHAPIAWLLRKSGVIDAVGGLHTWGLVLLVAFAILLTVALSQRPVRRLMRPVVEPRLNWLLRPRNPLQQFS